MKFYIASRLENAQTVKSVADILKAHGHQHTYDWTVHGSVCGKGKERLGEVAYKELQGVIEADVVIVILPGGRGTHTELGAALASHKQILICAEDDSFFKPDTNTCSFYWHGEARRITGPVSKWVMEILKTGYRIDDERKAEVTP
ncbi:MAG: nucleoside 2-deoxyribosyltransferase [Eubacteriales bacterium]